MAEGRSLNRDAGENLAARTCKKLLQKTNWFKQPGKGEREQEEGERRVKGGKYRGKRSRGANEAKKEKAPVAVMFVPRTPGGQLATMVREAEAEMARILGDRIKIVERSGIKSWSTNRIHGQERNA